MIVPASAGIYKVEKKGGGDASIEVGQGVVYNVIRLDEGLDGGNVGEFSEQYKGVIMAAEKSGLDPEAYRFVMRALGHTFEMLGEKRHVTGRELVDGFRDLLRRECREMSPWLLRQWGVKTSIDIGRIVFDLIELKVLSKRDEDTIEDFREGLDASTDFSDPEEVSIDWRLMPISSEGGVP